MPGPYRRYVQPRVTSRTRVKSLILVAALLCTTSMCGSAADKAGNYAIWGLGGSSCHAFLKAQNQPTAENYQNFLMGYLTAFNTLSSDTYSATAGQSLELSMHAIRTYCSDHQMDSFDRAIQQTLTSLYTSRLRESPNASQVWRRSVEPK